MSAALFEKYGQEIELLDAQDTLLRRVKGFLQPLSLGSADAGACPTPGGTLRRERYLLIVPETAFAGDGAARAALLRGRRYGILRREYIDAPGGLAHWEAILRLEEEQL